MPDNAPVRSYCVHDSRGFEVVRCPLALSAPVHAARSQGVLPVRRGGTIADLHDESRHRSGAQPSLRQLDHRRHHERRLCAGHELRHPVLRAFDRFGQARVGRLALAVQIVAMLAFAFAALVRVPIPLLFALAIIMGLTQFSFGALVRTRWSYALRGVEDGEQLLNTAYAMEAAIDEIVFILGPILAAWLATSVHPVSQLFVPTVACGIGALLIEKVIPEGKKEMSAADFARGFRLTPEDVFADGPVFSPKSK